MPLTDLIRPVALLESPWNFKPSRPSLGNWVERLQARLLRREPAPRHQVLKAPKPADRWFVYFVYSPGGGLTEAHRFTLGRLRDMGLPVLIVLACERPESVWLEADSLADALIWKALPGYDFSAYSVALRAIAAHSPHATVLVLNDSVFGPFVDLRPFIDQSPWDMLGFTAGSLFENHVQSYAFVMRDITPARVQALASVLPADHAYSEMGDVVKCQEVRLARVASESMSVGACWYGIHEVVADPTLVRPAELVSAGFPFMKKSIVGGKHYRIFQPHTQDALRGLLAAAGHPVLAPG